MITHFNRDRLAKNLPDAYRKDDASNNAKILEIERDALARLREAISEIYDSLDFEKATGKTLDLYGDMVGQPRGTSTDEQYRILIRNRIIRNHTNSDYNGIMNALCVSFGCSPTDIVLTEQDEPCKVKISGLPISVLNANNIDTVTAVQIVQSLLPVGVLLEALDFSGTFEFSGGTDLVYDEATGFGDVDQTIGGYLGLLAGTQTSTPVDDDDDDSAVLGVGELGEMELGES